MGMNYLKTLILFLLLNNMLDCMTPVSIGVPKVWKVKFLLTLYELLQDCKDRFS